ncbi:DUF4230 domain-containing protein [Lutispora saccharofermentans]|uniref:DUF4230 domain-containing protein n=1 Tax=Lutispora saccharofermentans TaxID=3024236 RepID=A0ABT1NJQ4_9FIRM|nr:DUF4230 domain-containing protein [Lutispora saccharofermentans]MCQ1531309.1 DUF4230 domain-containing protein [Lutispora saccharofermentans]
MNFKKIISIKTIVILILVLAIILSVSKIIDNKKTAEPVSIVEKQTIEDSTVILERVERLWELSSNKYFYSNVVAFKDNMKIKDFQVPFTEKSFLIKYDGYLKAGINAQDIQILSNEGKAIEVKLKNSKILDHVIDEKSIYVYDEKNSVFNNLSINDIFNQLSTEKDKIETQLEEKGFLKDTDNNIKLFLEEFLKNLGYESVQISFENQ